MDRIDDEKNREAAYKGPIDNSKNAAAPSQGRVDLDPFLHPIQYFWWLVTQKGRKAGDE